MSNSMLYGTIVLLLLALTVALLGVALETGLWREFVVTECVLFVSAVASAFLLKERQQPAKDAPHR